MMHEHETAEILNPDSDYPILLLCEHANNKLPDDVEPYLGMDKEFLDSYHGYDLGIPEVARKCAANLGATCVMGVYSRLLIDLNRILEAPDLLHDHDDNIIIPANQNLSEEELQDRLDKYYHPYHEVCRYHVDRLQNIHQTPIIFSFHSFPRHQTSYPEPFPWNFTLHYKKDERVAGIFKEHLAAHYPDVFVGDNEPYNLKELPGCGITIHGERRGLPNLLIEIPNDQMTNDEETTHWANIVTEILKTVPEKIAEEEQLSRKAG